eukprot:1120425-Pleurochrysis_carterae.AAC.1
MVQACLYGYLLKRCADFGDHPGRCTRKLLAQAMCRLLKANVFQNKKRETTEGESLQPCPNVHTQDIACTKHQDAVMW